MFDPLSTHLFSDILEYRWRAGDKKGVRQSVMDLVPDQR
jgi:hypothetical protein